MEVNTVSRHKGVCSMTKLLGSVSLLFLLLSVSGAVHADMGAVVPRGVSLSAWAESHNCLLWQQRDPHSADRLEGRQKRCQ